MKDQYEYEGFCVIPSGLPDDVLDAARNAGGPLQPAGYHYNPAGRRVFEGWKTSQAVRDVAHAPAVLEAIRYLHDLEDDPRALQTINFDKGTNQPLHQDGIHFQTFPVLGRMIGAWVALEDMDEENGTLCYVPGSHHMGFHGWQDLGFPKVPVGGQFEFYHHYERYMERAAQQGGGPKPFICKKGDVLLWGLDLLHGGWPVKDPSRTRYSQVTHYYFPDVEKGWAPMFSDVDRKDYFWKSMRYFTREGQICQPT